MPTRNPTDAQTQEIYKIYCQLATIIHDYAVGQHLFKNKCYSWAITANYYSLMHCGRFICLLGLKDFPSMHTDLFKFLTNQKKFKNRFSNRLENQEIDRARFVEFLAQQFSDAWIRDENPDEIIFKKENGRLNIQKNNSFNNLLNNLRQFTNNQELATKINQLGKKLEEIKLLREDNSYELFIISHQINHSVLETEFPRAYKEIKRLNNEYLIFILELFVDYINSLAYKDYFIGFLKDNNETHIWAFKNLSANLALQNIDPEIIQDISNMIDEKLLNMLDAGLSLEDSFFDPIYFESFPDKNKNMRDFINHINVLIGERPNE